MDMLTMVNATCCSKRYYRDYDNNRLCRTHYQQAIDMAWQRISREPIRHIEKTAKDIVEDTIG